MRSLWSEEICKKSINIRLPKQFRQAHVPTGLGSVNLSTLTIDVQFVDRECYPELSLVRSIVVGNFETCRASDGDTSGVVPGLKSESCKAVAGVVEVAVSGVMMGIPV